MADSGALRTERYKRHKAGDHSVCRRGCGGRVIPVAFPPSAAGDDAGVEPRAALERLARRLEAAHAEDPANALVARELRMTLQALAAGGSVQDDAAAFLAEFRGA
jgi:hypothetical protein